MKRIPASLINSGDDKDLLGASVQTSRQPCFQRHILSPAIRIVLEDLRKDITLAKEEAQTGNDLSSHELEALIHNAAARHGLELSRFERDEILLNIEKEQMPFGILQALVDDPTVTDIIVTNHEKVSIQQGRRSFATDYRFPDADSYEAFVQRILSKAGATYSTKKPIADGMIGAFARVHAVHPVLCETGPYLTVRLNRFASVSTTDLRLQGLAPKEILDYLNAVVANGNTVLIAGEVGTGKTTLARALASGISEQEAILVIEDTPEIRLAHPNVRYITTRDPNSDGAGRVTPAECIRAGMRMAMNHIIFGEIRDAEAAEAFVDVCASGHPGLSTIHARSAIEAVSRLQLFLGRAQRGVDPRILSEQIATAVQVVVHMGDCRVTGKRRVFEVKEIGPVADGVLRQRDIFRYHLQAGTPAWRLLNRVSAHKEALENIEPRISLSFLPAVLELELDVAYRETAGKFI